MSSKVAADMNTSWQRHAACRDEDPELFFPKGNRYTMQAQVQQAKAVCSRCSVCSDCLAWAFSVEQGVATYNQGILGGKTAEERAKLRKKK